MRHDSISKKDLLALQIRIQMFRVAFADMSVKAAEALTMAQEMGLAEEAYEDMFGNGKIINGHYDGSTEHIQDRINEACE